jgi:hypothetical protein
MIYKMAGLKIKLSFGPEGNDETE